jgi:hypothetical protein
MRKGIVVLALLATIPGAAWAGGPSPTREDAPQAVGQVVAGVFDSVPALPGRTQATPVAAAPLDDGSASFELASPPGGTRASTWHVPGDFATIQAAIAGAADGDTIIVGPGTYVEVGQIVINKTLTIIGDPADWPVIKPAQDTGGSGDARGWWLVNAGQALALQYLILDGDAPTRNVHTGIRSWGTVDVRDCLLKNNVYPGYDGRGIGPYAGTNNVIQHVTFQNMGRIGALIFGSGVYATVDQCTYTGKGDGDWLDYGFELGGGGGATISNCTITGCTGVALSDGSTSVGLLITTYFGAGTAGTVLGNVLTGNSTAIATGYDAADTSAVVAHYNDVSGCAYGVQNTSSTLTVNAEKNWWGTTNAATIATKVNGSVDYTPYLLSSKIRAAFAGNRLAATQNADGGWGWPLTGPSAPNTLAPIAMGLARTYEVTSDPDLYTALQKAGACLLTKTNNFSPPDGYLAAELDRVFGGTTYVTHLNNNFYGPLAGGTYNRNGAGTLYDTAAYVNYIRSSRASQGVPNLAAWDLGTGLVAAACCGVSGAQLDIWIAGVEGEINELDGDGYYDVVGLAGGLYALAFVHEEFDPTGGEHAAAGSLADLADILAGYQIDASGGFTWNSNYLNPYEYNETVQETAYAILALAAVGGHDPEIQAAGNWLLSFQLGTGGWMDYVGSSENNEISAEGAWGVWQMEAEQLTLAPDSECYNAGDTVTVEIWMHDISQNVVGGQFFLEYDNTKLDFQSASPGAAPFTNELYEVVNETAGTIDYSVYAAAGDPGVAGDGKMAVLTFQALTEICGELEMVTWRPHNPPSRLSGGQGQGIYPALTDLEVVDNLPPELFGCPGNATIECDSVPTPPTVTATDNCDPSPTVSYAEVRTDGACPDNYTLTRTWTATDHCDNSAACTQTITVQDTTPPLISPAASDLTVECDGAGNAAELAAWLASHGGASATDNCGDVTWSNDFAGLSDLCGATGAATVVFTATDDCGNSSATTATFTIADTTPPTITFCPPDTEVECDGAGNTAALNTWLNSFAATDTCGGVTLTNDFAGLSDDCCATGTATVTFTATDACNLPSTCQATFTIVDTTPPTISGCPSDISVNADADSCTAVVTWAEPTASDVCCGTVPWTARSHAPGSSFPVGTTTVTYTFIDGCGNLASCSFSVTVSAYNELVATVLLDAPFTGTRCITFETWECPSGPTVQTQVLAFTNGTGTTAVPLLVPCGGAYIRCITARDVLHTLRTTVTPTIVGTQYVADFTGGDQLLGGNLNDDYWIDILDFGILSWQWSTNYGTGNTDCSTVPPHADISGNGTVFTEDFTFIQINFLKGHEANCCGQPNFRGDAGPVTRISVADLIAQGLGELAAGDINGDGWLDEQDMADFAAGLPPPVVTGDLNCDGAVNFGDINPFVMAISNPAAWQQAYPGCNLLNADVNGDGNVDFGDINPFIALLNGN